MTASALLRWGLAIAVVAVLLPASRAEAVPRFAVREGMTCRACHVNPSGGGMRTPYGRYVYAFTRLPAGYPGNSRDRKPLIADLGDAFSLGGDLRGAYIDQRPSDPAVTPLQTLFLMQADLYATVTPFEGFTLYYDQGAYGSFEAFALYEHAINSWASVYMKAGRFMPAYGLRLENHNTFVRQDAGFGPRDKDNGAEIGAHLGPLHLQADVINGVGADRQLDENKNKGIVARAEWIGRRGPWRALVGASVYRNLAGTRTEVAGIAVNTRAQQSKTGLHWGAALGRFAYLGEADLVRLEPDAENLQTQPEHSFRSYQELDVLLTRGLDLTLNYEFREPDLDLESGRAHRVSAGFELHPMPNLELKVLYRHSLGSGPAEQAQDGFDELIGMVHAYF